VKTIRVLAVAGLMASSALVLAQEAPESLLPPGFEQPRAAPSKAAQAKSEPKAPAQAPPQPKPSPRATPAAVREALRPPASPAPVVAASTAPSAPFISTAPAAQPLASASGAPGAAPGLPRFAPGQIPPLEVLEKLTPDQLDEVLGLNGRGEMPDAARRTLDEAGIIDATEGGFALDSLSAQDASLVRAAIEGNKGVLVSRWGHILLRRALATRLAPPVGMNPADFAAMRAALLLRMGEANAARALVQDIDVSDYTPPLTNTAFDAYVATGDFTGICPEEAAQEGTRNDPPWKVAGYICDAFRGDTSGALSDLDHGTNRGLMARIDMLLAQKYVGAAGKGVRAVTIEWNGVDAINPWRYGLALAVGLEPPDDLMKDAPAWYDWIGATAPMRGLAARAQSADVAGATGILSSAAMVDLYSQIYSDPDVTGDWSTRAGKLREAYTAAAASDRLAAMRALWGEDDDPQTRYSRQVVTAYAAARLPVSAASAKAAGDLLASMLTAGLDANAARWSGAVEQGSLGWALLALAAPDAREADTGTIESFAGSDRSDKQRKSGFLVAGLAGLGRLSPEQAANLAGKFGTTLGGDTRWTRIIDRAAQVRNPELVALLVGVGMQGDDWRQMTPRFLYHIVSALRAAGLEPEARMIAAEAVARV
jgi:hypothetical protein